MSAEFLMRGQLRYLNTNGFRVTLLSYPGPELERAGRREGVPWHPVTQPQVGSAEARERAVERIADQLRTLRPTVVLASIGWMGVLGLAAARRIGVPVRLYQLNGLPLETAVGQAREAQIRWEASVYDCAHRVFCVSPSLRSRYIELGLDPDGKTRVLGQGSSNGVDTDRFRPPVSDERRALRGQLDLPLNAKIVGWVGRLAQVKGIPDLADAFLGSVLKRHPDAHLLIVGGRDPYRPISDGLAERLRSHPRVTITGYIDDPSPYYRAMDVFAFPSHREGFGNAALEASASGLPVVGYGVTGTVDAVVDGVTGALVERQDVTSLAERISAYLSDSALRGRDGRRGRSRVIARFRRERVWEELRLGLAEALADFDQQGRRSPARTRQD